MVPEKDSLDVAHPRGTDRTFREDFEAAEGVEEKRAALDDCLERFEVRRGRPGRRTTAQALALARLTLVLKPTPKWAEPDEKWGVAG